MPMHDDEVASDPGLVRELVAAQFPRLADLPVTAGPAGGTDHRLFRLGAEFLVRMPKVAWAADQATSDWRWLPRLAPHLPVAVPAPLAVGEPGLGYPFRWSVVPWLPGRPPTPSGDDPIAVATQLGGFVAALRAVAPADGPLKADDARGGLLGCRDEEVVRAIEECGDRIDQRAVLRVWRDAVSAAPPAVRSWIHGDLLPGNMLVDDGRLTGVIDWGAVGVGDSAVDLWPAWTHGWDDGARGAFREIATDGMADVDDAWQRARGWVVVMCAVAIPYYWETFPEFARASQERLAGLVTTES
ncbi:aminoglycoside phosphotransferase family protein [Myceligenerans crystallogenes]|uniref:Aminoglycoside phosphotransferase family protein n=1 Tax=Myceligenerans crystallogenes TaxID=316335 RepID=A0ABN2NHQ8_9MICO